MKFITIFILLFLGYLLDSLSGLPFLLIFVISLSSTVSITKSSLLAFMGGILADIGGVRLLGLSSLFFLIVSLVIYLYRRKFSEQSLWFLIISTFVSANIYLFLFTRDGLFNIVPSIISTVVAVVITFIIFRTTKNTASYEE